MGLSHLKHAMPAEFTTVPPEAQRKGHILICTTIFICIHHILICTTYLTKTDIVW